MGGAHQRNKIQHHLTAESLSDMYCIKGSLQTQFLQKLSYSSHNLGSPFTKDERRTFTIPAESPVATPGVRILAGQCSVGVGRGRCKTVQNLAPTLPNIGCSRWTLTIAHCPAPATGSGSVLAQNGMRRGDKTHFSSHAYCHAQKIV